MTKIRVADVRSQVLNAARADELAVAAGNNTLISKSEQKVLSADLQDAAEEVRRKEPGKTVSVDDVLQVVGARFDAAVATVNQAGGSGKPFLSKEEVKNLANRDPLTGGRAQRAYDVLAGPSVPAGTSVDGATAKAKLDAIFNGSGAGNATGTAFFFDGLLGSEGGEAVSAVLLPAMPWPASGDQLARALGHDVTTDVGAVERYKAPDATLIKEFLDQQTASPATVAEVGGLLRGLSDLRVLVVGKDGGLNVSANHPTYIVGAATDGTVVGIKTGVIWT